MHSSILAWRIPIDRGAWRARVHVVAESDMTEVTDHARMSTLKAYLLVTWGNFLQSNKECCTSIGKRQG